MAETGVTESSNENRREEPAGNRGSFFKRNKKVILIGSGIGGFLLLSHKGSQASGNTGANTGGQTVDATQAQADALAAQQAALESGSVYAPSGYDPSAGSGAAPGNDTSGANTTDSSGDSSNGLAAAAPTTPADQGGAQQINVNIPANQPPTPDKEPPNKKGKTQNKNRGAKVANPHHSGSGATVHGRTFPGARGATVHPGQKQVNGDVHNRVTVHYGGHTENHTSVNNGQHWIDHSRGSNPPSRGVPTTRGTVSRPAPERKRVHR